jgi:4-amino-4-deoxy-L-arabinose transferase-like glycosyltransferase
MSDARWSTLLFAAAVLVRVVAWLGSAIFGTDSGHYLLMADWFREGRFQDALSIAYHPIYPLLIASVRTFTGTTDQAGSVVSILLGSAAVIPLVAVVRPVFGRPAAVITALFYAFHPLLVEVQSDVMTEGTYLFFLFGSMWLTRRMMEEPSAVRGAVLGASAAAAFLTRPEGLLAIALALAWPGLELLRHRNEVGRRLCGVAATVAVIALLLSPYLLWVRSERGRWGLSVRPSAVSGERAVGLEAEGEGERPETSSQGRYYALYARSLFRLSGFLIPFYLIGAASLGSLDRWKAAFYFSFPLGQMGGILLALRTHNFMSDRYLLGSMTLMSAVAAVGILSAIRWAGRRWPAIAARPAVVAFLLLVLTVLPGIRCLKLRRQECLSYPSAARWILAQAGNHPRGMSGPVEQVAYLCDCRSYYTPTEAGALRTALRSTPVDFIVYSEKDVRGRPEYVAMLRSFDGLEAPVSIQGPPGTWTVFVQRVK